MEIRTLNFCWLMIFTLLSSSVQATGFDSSQLDQYLFPKNTSKAMRTHGVFVTIEGQPVYERYAVGYGPKSPHIAWSVSKAVTSALVGIAHGQGLLNLNDSICKFFPELNGKHCEIRVDDLMRWSSGLDWRETYEGAKDLTQSSIIQMSYGDGVKDWSAFTLKHPVVHSPGTHWNYSSGDTNVLMAILKKVMPKDQYERFPWTALFEPLGMESSVWERDLSGTFSGSSYFYTTPRSLAKMGALYMNDGVYEGKTLLPSGWVKYSLSVAPSLENDPSGISAGAQWWLNKAIKGKGKPWPAVPEDAFLTQGHWGQFLLVIPSKQLVAVRMGDDKEGGVDFGLVLEMLLKGISQ